MKISPVELAERVERWQYRLAPLGVAHWRIDRIIVGDESPSGVRDANATAGVSGSYDSVIFFFSADYLEEATPRELDETIVHEWIHVTQRDLDELQNSIEPWMPEATYEGYRARYMHSREGEVERLARLVVSLYYAPSKATPERLARLFRTVHG